MPDMPPLTLRTHQRAICMLDSIDACDENSVTATRKFAKGSSFFLLEAAAQVCALHVRWHQKFNCHAFLLSVTEAAPLPPKDAAGIGRLEAERKSVSQRAIIYQVEITIPRVPPVAITLTIGTVPYGQRFQADRLKHHYQRLFASLTDRTKQR